MKRFINGMKKQWSLERFIFDDVPTKPVSTHSQRVSLRVIEGGDRR